MTSGIVSSLSGSGGFAGVLQTTAPVQPGNSGGPLFDKSGYVIGVVLSRLNEPSAQNVNFAVKVELVWPFVRSANLALHTSARVGQIETTEIARKGGAYTVPLFCLQ